MRILSLSDVRGQTERLSWLPKLIRDTRPDLIVFTGNVLGETARLAEWEQAKREGRAPTYPTPAMQQEEEREAQLYELLFDTLGQAGIPAAVIPGAYDSPKSRFLRSALHHETVFPNFHSVHASFMTAPERSYVVAGFGGALDEREREDRLVFLSTRWETEYGLKFLTELEQARILLFHAAPEGIGTTGTSPIVNSLIKMYRPHFVFCGGSPDVRKKDHLGDSLVILPGGLVHGHYALLDTRSREVEFGHLG